LATVLETKKGETARLFARWLPAAQTIELDKPLERSEGWPRWGYADAVKINDEPDRKAFVIYGGNYDDDSPIYVTGSTKDVQLRIIPGNGNEWTSEKDTTPVVGYNYYDYESWNRFTVSTGTVREPNEKIPHLYRITPLKRNTTVRVRFVNAKIELSDGRNPVDVGPYHEFENLNEIRDESELRFDISWSRARPGSDFGLSEKRHGAWLGKFGPNNRWLAANGYDKSQYYVRWNDHEIKALLEFEGQNNVITSTGATAFALWNSRYNLGPRYTVLLPTRPDVSYSPDFKTPNIKEWEEYRKKCFLFIEQFWLPYSRQHNITYPDDKLDEFNSMGGWDPSVLQLKFRGGAKLEASIRDPANGDDKLTETLDINTGRGRGQFWEQDEGLKLGSYLWNGDGFVVGGWDAAPVGGSPQGGWTMGGWNKDNYQATVLWGTWR
ncbi:MAG: hypothetical protein LBU18_02640, partial [Treponema sp.]|nr:hypothetical protein [Treponema sp.]